jgi:glutamine amidotransferase
MSGVSSVVVVDLGLGNLASVARALTRAGAAPRIARDPEEVARADRLVLPGQGAFRDFAAALGRGFREAIVEAMGRGTPYLGICLGMQGLFDTSEEAPEARGLGHFAGAVVALSDTLRDEVTGAPLKVPHMGWNLVRGEGFGTEGQWLYFVHSFACVPTDSSLVIGRADYGVSICAAVARDNVLACQFHPEKSQSAGQAFLTRFLAIG